MRTELSSSEEQYLNKSHLFDLYLTITAMIYKINRQGTYQIDTSVSCDCSSKDVITVCIYDTRKRTYDLKEVCRYKKCYTNNLQSLREMVYILNKIYDENNDFLNYQL